MNSLIKVVPNVKKYKAYLDDLKQGVTPIMVSGLTDSGKTHFAYSTYFYQEKPICIVTYNEMQTKKIIKDLSYFDEDIEFFPKKEIFAYDYIAESNDTLFERIKVLNNIKNKTSKIIVTTIESLMQPMINSKVLYSNSLRLQMGQEFNLDDLKDSLVKLRICEI